MDVIDTSLSDLIKLIERRLALVRNLAESLEFSSLALAQNDAEAIARGAAHQAELCRQWSCLEDQLRRQTGIGMRATSASAGPYRDSSQADRSARLQEEWEVLSTRIRYLTRVHSSLLRHLQRSLAIISRVVEGCAPTYTPDPSLLRPEVRTEDRLPVRG